jgi:3'-5' exoribonuclease
MRRPVILKISRLEWMAVNWNKMDTEEKFLPPVYMTDLTRIANHEGVLSIANVVLTDPRFRIWSGSSKSNQHHYGDGGLIEHTWEVIKLCRLNMTFYHSAGERYFSDKELFLAALFHDAGKMWDYEKVEGVWRSAEHKRLIHHVSRSAIVWSKAVEMTGTCKDIEDSVLHAILAHHGCREFGSPVAPKTKLAWMLHICDQMSARMNDADKIDLVNER